MRLKGDKNVTLLTTMVELKGRRPSGFNQAHGGKARCRKGPRATSAEEHILSEEAELGYNARPYCVIIGGSRVGLPWAPACADWGYLHRRRREDDRPGDSWRNRYKSLCLHDPVWYDHLPYIKFPENDEYFAQRQDRRLAGNVAKVMELNYWTRTTAKSATFDETTGSGPWSSIAMAKRSYCSPRNSSMSTTMSGRRNTCKSPRNGQIQGRATAFLSEHDGPDAWKGKKVVVVGSNNQAHDICAAL